LPIISKALALSPSTGERVEREGGREGRREEERREMNL
jgi:hypothetical protein